ncbi:MAG: glycosyltransferase, partial [Clostridiaceae bacterium]
ERYINENSLEDTVKLMGFQSNPYPYIKAADFFVCSSRAEGLSTVVTEAMILGKPVITTDCAGMRELLDEGRYGIITDNSSDSLYSALRDVFLDIDSIRTFGNRAAEGTRAFDIRENINKIETILEMGQYVQ